MYKPIKKLSPHLASLIAAGEVIKRPEDIIRELLDNSIDAGATQITLNIEQGGLEKIQIQDNGSGIIKEDLPLALLHHATSKIESIDDIETIQTLGFRGEALASICAVARIHLCSRTRDSSHGWQIQSAPGFPVSQPKPVAHPIGTTITITELFYQIPARRRFLRSPATEFGRIERWVKHFGLSHAECGLSLTHNQRDVLNFIKTDQLEDSQQLRLIKLYNSEFAKTALAIDSSNEVLSIRGWISSPNFVKTQPDWQCFYVNGRLIKDKALNHAVKKAYQDILYRDRYPAFALFLNISTAEIDVNIHPTKAEIRFHRLNLVYEFVYRTLKKALTLNKANENYRPLTLEQTPPALQPTHLFVKPSLLREDQQVITAPATAKPQASFESVVSPSLLLSPLDPEPQSYLGEAIAQLHNIYILAQNAQGLMIVDAHAAHERIIYEKLKQSSPRRERQQLLIPVTLSISEEEQVLSEEYCTLFKEVGFEYELKPLQLTLHTVPSALSNLAFNQLFKDILSDLRHQGSTIQLTTHYNRLLSTIACRSATRAGRPMNVYEMNQLLRSIEKTPSSSQCNHGRPTFREVTLKEIDAWFLRGQ